jgi:hypothetical protein
MNARVDREITREDWDQHVADDDERGRDINELKLAMFGDLNNPETVKQAVMPTMTRLNTYLDGIVILFKISLALLAGGASCVAIAKGMGWM